MYQQIFKVYCSFKESQSYFKIIIFKSMETVGWKVQAESFPTCKKNHTETNWQSLNLKLKRTSVHLFTFIIIRYENTATYF